MEKVTLTQQDIDGFNPNQLSIVRSSLGVREGELVPGTYDAGDNFFRNLVETNLIKKPTRSVVMNDNSGVSGGAGLLDEKIGALAPFINQATQILDSVYASTSEPTQREKDINMGRAALKFFTTFGAQSSVPGATALGAANQAGALVAKDYLAQESKKESDAKKLAQAKKSTALSLGMQLKSADDAREIALGKKKKKYVPLYKDGSVTNVIENSDEYIKKVTQEDWQLTKPAKSPGFTYKSVDAGIPATYMMKEDAEKLLEPYVLNGLDKNSNAYKRAVKALTVPEDKPSLLGKEIIKNNLFASIKPVQIGEKIGDVVIFGDKDLGTPDFVEFKKEYSKKYGKDFQGTVATYAEVIPKIQSAMEILIKKGGPDTGKLAEFTLPFKQIINQAFGNTDPGVRSLESLQSIAFYLATKMRPKGSGSTSDMEFRAYMKAALSLGNSAEANYISLYAMKKMKENAEIMNEEAFRLIDNGEVRSVSELNSALKKKDTGLFKKFDFSKFDGEVRDSNGQFTSEFIEARNQWENTLDAGDVVISTGVYDGDSPYRIVDWRKN